MKPTDGPTTPRAEDSDSVPGPVAIILRAKARMLLGRGLGAGGPILVLIALVAAALAFVLGRFFFLTLLEAAPAVAGGALAGAVTMLALVLLLSTTAAAFSTLYASSDLELLLVWPLSGRQVFGIKLVEVASGEVTFLLALGLPLLAAYGAAAGAPGWFYLLLPVLGLVLAFLPTGLALLLNVLAMRLIPPHRAREVGIAVGVLLGAAVYAVSQLLPATFGGTSLEQAGLLTSRLAAGYLPTAWFASGLATAAAGDLAGAVLPLVAYAAAGGAVLAMAFAVVPAVFAAGWVGEPRRRRGRRARAAVRSNRTAAARAVGRPALALARKEVLVVLRDAAEWTQAAYGLVVIAVLVISSRLRSGDGFGGLSPGLAFVLTLALSMMGFGSSVGLGTVAREGKALWLPLTVPLPPTEWLLGKVLGVMALSAPVAVPAAVLVGALTAGLGPGEVVLVTFAVALALPGAAAISVYAGALSPEFEATDPRRRVPTSAAMSHFLLQLAYLGGAGILLGAAFDLGHRVALELAGGTATGLAALALWGVAALGVAGVGVASWLVARSCLSAAARAAEKWDA